MIQFEIDIPVLKSTVTVIYGDSKAEIKKQIPKGYKHAVSNSIARTIHCTEEPNKIFICLRSIAMSVVAHEAVHAGQQILRCLGIDSRNDGGELLAYITQHICEKAEKVFWDI